MSSSSTDEEDDATNPTNHDPLPDVTPEQFHTFAVCLKLVVTTAVNAAMNSILLQALSKITGMEEEVVFDPPNHGQGGAASGGTSLLSPGQEQQGRPSLGLPDGRNGSPILRHCFG